MSAMTANVQEMIGTSSYGGQEDHVDYGYEGVEDSGLGVEGGDHGTAGDIQPTFHFRGFMQFKNEDKSVVILCGHLSQLARMAPSFEAVGYGMSETTEAAEHLVGYGVFNLRQLLDKQAVFHGDKPTWPVDQDEGPRAVALLLREALLDMKAEVIKTTAQGNKPLPVEERDEKRGRSRSRRTKNHKKSKHYKRSRSSSSGGESSSSSGSRKRHRNENVVAAFRGSAFVAFGTDLLPPDNIVMKIGKNNRRLATKGVQDACRRSLEEFVPSYLGRDLASDARKKAIQARKSSNYLEGPQFMEHWMGYWIAHGIYGLITNEAFCTAIAVMTRFVSQRGAGVAAKYFRVLIPHINAKISTLGEDEYIANLDPFITTLNTDLLAEVKAFSGEAERVLRPQDPYRKPHRPPTAPPPAQAKFTQAVAGRPKTSDMPCLHHNVKQSLTCGKQDTCKYAHLDTNIAQNLKKWNQAKAAQEVRASKGKGKGKDKGKK